MVDRFYLLGGDFFQRETATAEQMTIWRNTAKKNEAAVFAPIRHDPAKQFWREFPSVFCKEKNVRQPGVVCWVKTLQRRELHILDPNRRIHFRISGMQYGDKDFFVNDSFSDSLTFQAGLLDELSCEWQERIVREINNCEKAAQCVGYLAQDIAIAAGNKNENVGVPVREQFYFAVDQPFRLWLQADRSREGRPGRDRSALAGAGAQHRGKAGETDGDGGRKRRPERAPHCGGQGQKNGAHHPVYLAKGL